MIITPRLVLRRHNELAETIKNEVRWLNDPEVVKYSDQRHRQHTPASQREYLDSLLPYDSHFQIWLGERHIGGLNIYHDPYNKVVNMGILIGDKDVWGQGFGLEAWNGMMNAVNCRRIEAGCMDANIAMRQICKRSGMTHDATVPGHFLLEGAPVAMLLFGKFK